MAYNYETFPLDMDADVFAAFRDAVQVGQRAPRATLVDAADGTEVSLRSLWRAGPLVLEFGSFT